MKSILVPTDFSACAKNAEDVAIDLAKRFTSRLHFFHQIALKEKGEISTGQREEFDRQAENARSLVAAKMKEYPQIDYDVEITTDPLYQGLQSYVNVKAIDMVVMGSHGSSGKNEFFMGSNTQRVVRTLHCPILVIKKPVEKLQFEKVVFASNFSEAVRPAFLKFKSFIKHFLPEIHLVAIHTSSLFDPPYIVSKDAMEGFKVLCAPFTCHTHIYRDFTIDQGIRSFANDIGADLIAISNHERHPLKRILTGSNVEALVNHADLPVMSIDYQKSPD
jgi:nucleotide-binding universal stress UspA family protein